MASFYRWLGGQFKLTAPRKPTRPADDAAAFVVHGAAAVGAGAHGDAVFGLVRQIHLGSAGQDFGDSVRAGEHLTAVAPVGVGAADAADLLDDGVQFDAGPEGQRDEPAGGLDLRGSTPSGFAHLGEDLTDALFIRIDRDVKFAAAGGNTP